MRIQIGVLHLAATDLSNHLSCRHLTTLDLLAARGEIERIYRHDPGIDVLAERGIRHEAAYLEHLRNRGFTISEHDPAMAEDQSLQRTIDKMRAGVQVISQANLADGNWRGRADVLLRVEMPSSLGAWSYEVVDTKLARETRAGTILQLCLYSELVGKIQGTMPEYAYVVKPGEAFEPEAFRLNDYLAYYRFVKSRLENETADNRTPETYPEPVEHCDLCSWWPRCDPQRRKDDHLSFVAGISKLQITELRKHDVATLAALAQIALPLQWKPRRGSTETLEKIREQARLQLQSRTSSTPVYELLDFDPEHGLSRLPEPSRGDVFLDFESDPFVEPGGLEYLLGFLTTENTENTERKDLTAKDAKDAKEKLKYRKFWAMDRVAEKASFESFIDFVMQRWKQYPDMHTYHFTHYEPSALKRLMCRYASREDEIDRMLRAELFVDLHAVVRQSLRAGVEKYSLKDLELFFGFRRATDLRDASLALRRMETILELNDTADVPAEITNTIEGYNSEDCLSTLRLREWLEGIRSEQIEKGKDIARPTIKTGEASEKVDAQRQRVLDLMNRLLQDIPVDESQRSPEQQATWLLAHMLEYHRRENKAPWWEYFRLCSLTDDELLDERSAISGLEFIEPVPGKKAPIHRYRFPFQETDVREGDKLQCGEQTFGEVVRLNKQDLTIDVKKLIAMKDHHPRSVFSHRIVPGDEQAESLLRIAGWVADHGVDADGDFRAGRDLLLRKSPRLRSASPAQLYDTSANSIVEARRLACELDHGVLPIQGPPGAGKTFLGARMICELLRAGKKVGITAVSHKVIEKLIEEVEKAAKIEKVNIRCSVKVGDKPAPATDCVAETDDNAVVRDALKSGEANLGAGTAWMWSREEFAGIVDVLFVDEAGQMCLADVLAVSQSAKSLVLLGDPRQLEQPQQGTHPPGVEVSALEHILGDLQTMPGDRGLFLNETWRLAPAICEFTSELFYDGKLQSEGHLGRQGVAGASSIVGSGLRFVPVNHTGNQSSSIEEADVVAGIVRQLVDSRLTWADREGMQRTIGLNDILIVAPYNAQVFLLSERLPNARIGTVDKFQGQEAPIVIYSMTTSSPADAPRGMEFLYSLNRFNVATSRARCLCILVANPLLFEPECKTPHQMKLANVLCRYRELAQIVTL